MPRSMTRRQRRAQATRNRLERRRRLRETRRLNRSPPAYLPSTPTHMRIKKLLLSALSGSSGINPYKKTEHLGDHKVKDIEYDIFKKYGIPKHGFKVAKERSKGYKSRFNQKFKPRSPLGALSEEEDEFTLSPSYMQQHYTSVLPQFTLGRGKRRRKPKTKKRKQNKCVY
jgi:hypothetical protein